jgi:hypothetical protein
MRKELLVVFVTIFLVGLASAVVDVGEGYSYKERIVDTKYYPNDNRVVSVTTYVDYNNDTRYSTYDYRHGYTYRSTKKYRDDHYKKDDFEHRDYDYKKKYRKSKSFFSYFNVFGERIDVDCYEKAPKGKLFYIKCP